MSSSQTIMPSMSTITSTANAVCVVSVRVGHTTLRTSMRVAPMKDQIDSGLRRNQDRNHRDTEQPQNAQQQRLVGKPVKRHDGTAQQQYCGGQLNGIHAGCLCFCIHTSLAGTGTSPALIAVPVAH